MTSKTPSSPDLETIRIPDGELAEWFNQALQAAFKNTSEVQRQQRLTLKKRTAEIEAMQERLLNAYLAGTIDEKALVAKQTQLRDEAATVAATLATSGEVKPEDVQTALGVFQFAHCVVRRPEVERRPNLARFKDGPIARRKILDAVSLNRLLGDVTLVVEKRNPFDELVKRPLVTLSRGDWRWTFLDDLDGPRLFRRLVSRRLSFSAEEFLAAK